MAANIKLKEIRHPFWQVIGIGTLAGMRTSSAPAVTSQILSHHHSKRLEKSPLNFMQSKIVANTLTVLSLGEVVMDKLPSTPNRTEPAGVIFRGLSGALAGASIYKASGNNVLVGSLLGAAAGIEHRRRRHGGGPDGAAMERVADYLGLRHRRGTAGAGR